MLYQQLGYILSGASQKLVCDSLITGLKLEESSETDIFCELYAYNKIVTNSKPQSWLRK